MAKWVWRFGVEVAPLWKKALCAKYGVPMDVLRWDWNCGANSSAFTKTVGNLFMQGSRMAKILDEGIRVVVGKWDIARGCLENVTIREACQDMIGWVHDANGSFSVKSFVNCLRKENTRDDVGFGGVWQGLCPSKIEIFVWQLLHGRILVRDVLKKFGMLSGVNSLCPLYLASEESINHLFLFSKGSPGPAGISGVLRNHRGEVICTFSVLPLWFSAIRTPTPLLTFWQKEERRIMGIVLFGVISCCGSRLALSVS
ncbi:hypothetical protein Dsin_013377 [Dipteronia sinensis]|uniref:Reverse transcriptase zinc-binding domain-containing protein n=1 Tax=Dipteronia sinensis TaxID=43782 RepID=A0AAE0AJY0_9ROSI|nr:hypothetical protein Dsin_013377 [Dipteronia sinensis]